MRNLERNHCIAIIKSMEHVPWPINKVLYTFDVINIMLRKMLLGPLLASCNFDTRHFSGKLKP